MRLLFLSVLLLPFLSTTAFAEKKKGNYMTLFYGTATSSSTSSVLDGASGSVMGGAFGLRSSDAIAWEFMVRKTNFSEKSVSFEMPLAGTVTQTSKIDALVIGVGMRWFFLSILNIHFGVDYSSASPNSTATVSNPAYAASVAAEQDASGLGLYYGGGLQIPLGGVDIFADYTINAFAGDTSSNEISGGLRLNF